MLVTRWWLELGSWLAAIQYSPSHTCRTPVAHLFCIQDRMEG